MSSTRGVFITLEGGEGAGKSTAARLLAQALAATGREIILTREPGGTPGAESIRALLLNPATLLAPLADCLLHFAARADHTAQLITPALMRGAIVICDRYYDSTMAYQAYGMGVDKAAITALISLINVTPDITFILEVPEFVAKERLTARGTAADRYDEMGSAFMAKIAAGFRAIARAEPERCVLVDASVGPACVQAALMAHLEQRLNL